MNWGRTGLFPALTAGEQIVGGAVKTEQTVCGLSFLSHRAVAFFEPRT